MIVHDGHEDNCLDRITKLKSQHASPVETVRAPSLSIRHLASGNQRMTEFDMELVSCESLKALASVGYLFGMTSLH